MTDLDNTGLAIGAMAGRVQRANLPPHCLPSFRAAILCALCASAVIVLCACEPYRVEYHRRPAYYNRLADGLPDRVVLDDGTVLVYNETGKASGGGNTGGEKKTFQVREELEDGSVILRALTPEHVIGNTLHCLQLEEYELLWDQMLSERTKMAYETRDEGVEEFAAFLQKHRVELGRMLNRMLMGLASYEVVVENAGNNTLVCRFWPQVAKLFRFKKVAMVHEDFGLKLLLIY